MKLNTFIKNIIDLFIFLKKYFNILILNRLIAYFESLFKKSFFYKRLTILLIFWNMLLKKLQYYKQKYALKEMKFIDINNQYS